MKNDHLNYIGIDQRQFGYSYIIIMPWGLRYADVGIFFWFGMNHKIMQSIQYHIFLIAYIQAAETSTYQAGLD